MAFVDRMNSSVSRSVSPVVGRIVGGSSAIATPLAPLPNAALATRDRVRDLTALALLAASAFVIAALATFDPADPPLARMFPPHAWATNACGVFGSAVASSLYEIFGLGAWFVVVLIAGLDLLLLNRRVMSDLPLRTSGAVVATVGICTLLAMFLPDWVGRPIWGPGGYTGATGRLFAEAYFARAGAAIVVLGVTMAGLFLACDTLFIQMMTGLFVGVAMMVRCLTACGSAVAGIAGYLSRLGHKSRDRSADILDAFPGLKNERLQSGSNAEGNMDDPSQKSDEDSTSDFETVAQTEPTIRMRRREKRVPDSQSIKPIRSDIADGLERLSSNDLALESDPSSEEGPSGESSAIVPIRSRNNRQHNRDALNAPADAPLDYKLPSIELLLPAEQLQLESQEQEVRERARILEKTFADFGFKVRVVEIETGPVISQYEIELEAGLRLAKISNLADDLAIALRVPSVRIVAPIPGKNSVGIEVPNTDRQMVTLREVIEETQSKTRTMKIPIYLGKDVAGNPMVVDMATLPHLLIAGRTGTGKSVCLNSIIVSMLMSRRPDEVRMLMIDPKMVELTPYKSLPHLMHPVVTDMKKAEAILAWAVEKMEERYTLLASVGVRHLSQYNQLGRDEILRRMNPEGEEARAAVPTTMPYIVVIADEIADMMMTAGKEIEAHIIRLAQKSRAVGIHLVLATQKPTVDVITGLIKSNLPARIAFQVASRVDSRVVLDECGADRLLGNGDMLFLSPGTSTILRGQGTYVSDEEIGRVMNAIGTSDPQYAQELINLQPAPSGDGVVGVLPKLRDDLYEAAVEVVIREGRGSVSLLQRALGVGYGRGARLIDFMAEDGIVGQYAGSQAREVILTMEQWALRNGTTVPAPDPAPRRLKIQPHAVAAAHAVTQTHDSGEENDDADDLDGQSEIDEESADDEDFVNGQSE
ncbi:MAG: DNA translocase FtsK [Planctomycetota bacterium]